MNFKILQYEIKQIEWDCWKMVSEATALELLQDNFSKITPIIAEMLQGKEMGKEIIIPKGILRIKKLIK
jgi:hypothetical protein